MTLSVGKPPQLSSALTRMTEDVPQQKAPPHASFEAKTWSKKKRCSSGQT